MTNSTRVDNTANSIHVEERNSAFNEEPEAFVRMAMSNLTGRSSESTRSLAYQMGAITAWAVESGFDLDVNTVLSSAAIEYFVANTTGAQGTVRSRLRRLAAANGVPVERVLAPGYDREVVAVPYSKAEVAMLRFIARSFFDEYRQACLRGLVVLGLGVGLARNSLRDVEAASVHYHGVEVFVHAAGRCIPVLEEYVEELIAVCALRSEGQLIGNVHGRNLTYLHRRWVRDRPGAPPLRPDRLRATWICQHLEAGTQVNELLTWAGLQSAEAFDPYLAFVTRPSITCASFEELR
jgi:5-carboxymethyl-2-hydroxymuconate isomerase